MAAANKGKEKPNQPTSKKYTKYTINGDKVTRAKSCLKCGPGVFMMVTPDRAYCGRCRYTEFINQKK